LVVAKVAKMERMKVVYSDLMMVDSSVEKLVEMKVSELVDKSET
jgi:hypothetical protein